MHGAADTVAAAITSRRSIRAYLPDPVPRETVERLLDIASRAPSGTNMQPWWAYALAGEPLKRLSAALVADHVTDAAGVLPVWGVLGVVLVATMAVTPMLNNAATVLMVGPIGAGLATRLGLNPDPFLMAVAVGAACDFLTPFGHQCNTLVMGPGGYRFGDYWKLGLPLSILIVVIGVPLIAAVWPLGGG